VKLQEVLAGRYKCGVFGDSRVVVLGSLTEAGRRGGLHQHVATAQISFKPSASCCWLTRSQLSEMLAVSSLEGSFIVRCTNC
jgi:hypothetical protein